MSRASNFIASLMKHSEVKLNSEAIIGDIQETKGVFIQNVTLTESGEHIEMIIKFPDVSYMRLRRVDGVNEFKLISNGIPNLRKGEK